MKKIYATFFTVICSVVLPLFATAQITITPSATAAVLAAKLTGPGVIVTSPVLTCTPTAEGTFAGLSTLSFDSGIVLTTGTALTTGTTIGAGGPASGFASTDNFAPGDPSLDALAGLTTYDACVLEFDFKPAGDTVKFNYVFGSEEYTSFTCSSFNDVFGFFISGPGYASATNIALVPGTTIPVCINSVNCGATGFYSTSTCAALGPGSPFCAYYVNNSLGTTITYDGLTTTLTAIAEVTPCNTYHLKIGVADGSDGVLDSGVFLEAGSLTSTGISISPLSSIPGDTTLGTSFCIRGCNPAAFVFNTTAPVAGGLTIHYVVGGTAVNGVDYSGIADSVVIPPGGSTGVIYINGLATSSAPGPVTVQLFILAPYTCGGLPVYIDSPVITIFDSFFVHITTPDTAVCIGSTLTLHASGDPFLHYQWSPSSTPGSDTLLNTTITPTVTTTYTITGNYFGSGCAPTSSAVTVSVIQSLIPDVGPAIQNTCVGVPLQLNNLINPDTGHYAYSWTPAANLSNSTIHNPVVTPTAPGDYEMYVTDSEVYAGCKVRDSFLLHVLPNDFNLLNPDTGVCFNAVIQVRANGDSEFSYHWTPAFGVSDPVIITPVMSVNTTTTYTLTASYPGCPDIHHSFEIYVESPNVDILTRDTAFCLTDSVRLQVLVTPADSPYSFSWSPSANLYDPTMLQPVFTDSVTGDYTYTLSIQTPLGCISSDHVTLSPRPLAHISVTPGNTTINYGDHIQLDAINLTAYPLVYWWIPADGSLDNPNINNPMATPLDSTTYIVYAMNEWGCRDSAEVTIGVNPIESIVIPSAFTPNNDGRNDEFRLINIHHQKLLEFDVFNRWGQMVYHNSTDPKKGWDGTFNGQPQDIGIYHYSIILALPDGTSKEYKGDVTLLR